MFEPFTNPHRDRLPIPPYAQLPSPHSTIISIRSPGGHAPSVTENSRGLGQVPSTVTILFIDRTPAFQSLKPKS